MRILIVEDEEKLVKAIKKGLETQGFTVDYITEGEKAERRISLYRNEYDLIILDLMLPNKDGFEICKNVRDEGVSTPILILTARDSVDDKVKVLNSGADDYLVKPFAFDELVARIHALLRRPEEAVPTELRVGDIRLDPSTHKAYRQGKELTLTLKEFSLLEYLMRHPNQVLNREQILDHLWGFDFDSFSNVVDVHIKNLRKKLEHGRREKTLETVRGLGYRLKA